MINPNPIFSPLEILENGKEYVFFSYLVLIIKVIFSL